MIYKGIKYLSKFKFSNKILEYYRLFQNTEYFFIFTLAVFVGILTGLAEVLLIQLIHFTSFFFFPGNGTTILEKITNSPWYIVVTLPILGFIISVFVNKIYFKKSTTHGVASIIESVLLRSGFIKPSHPFLKGFTSAITIGTGGSVGPEGPAAYLGAGIGSSVSQFFGVSSQRMKTMLPLAQVPELPPLSLHQLPVLYSQ